MAKPTQKSVITDNSQEDVTFYKDQVAQEKKHNLEYEMENFEKLNKVRLLNSITAGTMAGIIGLVGLNGLLFLLFTHLLVSATIWTAVLLSGKQVFEDNKEIVFHGLFANTMVAE